MPGISSLRGNKLVPPAKDNWAFLALSLFGDESTARDLTTQILALATRRQICPCCQRPEHPYPDE
ncbi:hypothetical protein KZ770_13725 [Escherichia coli]|nr:hypothetical protein [Escherichia coli]